MNNKSKKGFTLVEIMIVVVIIGLLAAMAIPAFQKVRASSQDRTVLNNLRQVASAAQQYLLEQGVLTVSSADLIGSGEYITTIESVGTESYDAFTINTNTSQIQIASPSGNTITYQF